ncbi:hypothetical protein X975_12180, partial [Stegodyphus mimosarum]
MEACQEEMKAGQASVRDEMKAVKEEIACIIENKFEAMENRIDAVENKVEHIEKKVSSVKEQIEEGVDSVKEQIEGLSSCLKADAADILQTLPENKRLDFEALSGALELRFGEKCLKDYSRLQLKSRQQKATETLQQLATGVERLSHLAFSECPTETREILSLQYFIDGIRDPEIQKALRMADVKDLKSALGYAMKFEVAQQATRRDRHPIRAAHIQELVDPRTARLDYLTRKVNALTRNTGDKKPFVKCWNCGAEGHIRRNCRTPHGTDGNSAPIKKEGN